MKDYNKLVKFKEEELAISQILRDGLGVLFVFIVGYFICAGMFAL